MKTFDMFDKIVVPFKRKPKRQPMTKSSKIELYPIQRVEVYSHGKVVESYWVVIQPDGVEIQCKSYESALKAQQLDKKEKVC